MATIIRSAQDPDRDEYSRLEVDTSLLHTTKYSMPNRNDFPEVYNDALPEAHQYPGKSEPEMRSATAKPLTRSTVVICGIPKRLFWIIVAIILAIIVGAGVGGGVAASKRQSSSSESSPTSQPPQLNSMDILSNTQLAATSFTDGYGHNNYFVYYQRNSKQLYQSAYNSSGKKWTVSQVNNITLREGTPLASNIYWFNETKRNMHVYAIDDGGSIVGETRNIDDQLQKVGDWGKMNRFGVFTPSNVSRIVSYGRENGNFSLQNIIIYQDAGGKVHVLDSALGNSEPANINQPVFGSGLALAPILGDQNTNKSLAVFDIVSGAGSPRYASLDQQNKWKDTGISGRTELGSSTTIAAFSYGFTDKGDAWSGSGNDMGVQVLILEPGKSVKTLTFREGTATELVEAKGMEDEKLLIIAACQSGRVYGTTANKDGTVKIVEWEWISGSEYRKIGDVDVVAKEQS